VNRSLFGFPLGRDLSPELFGWPLGENADGLPRTPPVTDYEAWFDISDYASLTVAAGRLTNWNDLSGNAHHLAAVGGGTGPSYGSRMINRTVVADFANNSSERMEGNWHFPEVPATVLMVIEFDSVSTNMRVVNCKSAGGVNCAFRMNSSGNLQLVGFVTSADPESANFGIRTGTPMMVGFTHNGTTGLTWVKNEQRDTDSSSGPGTVNGMMLGARDVSTFEPVDGAIAEILLWHRALSNSEVASLYSYFRFKWGSI
jgi:hypothetical protein